MSVKKQNKHLFNSHIFVGKHLDCAFAKKKLLGISFEFLLDCPSRILWRFIA